VATRKLLSSDPTIFKSTVFKEGTEYRKSNIRTDPSAPHEAKICSLPATKATSNTSLSCAIKCVLACNVFKSHTVHVVSILAVTTRLGASLFQWKDVNGAENSVFGCTQCQQAHRSASFTEWHRAFILIPLFLDPVGGWSLVSSQRRRWSPDVARRFAAGLPERRGSHNTFVIGYS
jgi:hypothetical protein